MKTTKIKPIFLIFSLLFAFSCDKLEKVGPNICPSDAFSFTADNIIVSGLNSNGKIDLTTSGLNIKAGFGENVKWTLRITSASATKEYSGNSDSVNVNWFGNSDKLPLFDAGSIKIELEIACLSPFTKEYESINKPNFKNLNKSYGVLVRDWDKNGKYAVKFNYFDVGDGWQGVNGDGSQYFQYKNDNPSPVGGYYAEFYSKSDPTWYFGGHSFPTSNLKSHLSTMNADSLYLNLFVQGYGYLNTGLEIGVQENGATNYFYTAPIDWTGWKYVSIKMSELKVTSGGKAGTSLACVEKVGTCR